jgi:hypothetical protein
VFIGRPVPGVRTYVSLPAGFSGMPLPTFLLYSGRQSGDYELRTTDYGLRTTDRIVISTTSVDDGGMMPGTPRSP